MLHRRAPLAGARAPAAHTPIGGLPLASGLLRLRRSSGAASAQQQQQQVARRARALGASSSSSRASATPPYAEGFYLREMAPWPTDVPIEAHDLGAAPRVDLIVAGAGPSGLAVASRVAEAGFSVAVIDPDPLGVWPNNYGAWVDEFEAMGLQDCLEVVWPKAKVWLDSGRRGEK